MKNEKNENGEQIQKKKGGKLKWIIIAVVVLAIIGAAMGGSDNSETDTQNATATTESEPAEANEDASTEEPDEPEYTQYEAGMYKIGTDLPAGEYLLVNDSGSSNYWQVASDSSGELESIVANDNYMNRAYVSVSDGQYFTFQGVAIPSAEAPAFVAENGYYPEGTYLVGKDIPAGEYKLSLVENSVTGYGYYEVASDSTGQLTSIITNANIQGDAYQTIQDGQYLKLNGTEIKGQ